MIMLPCPMCFVGNIGIMPIITFDPGVQEHREPLAVLARHNREAGDEYLVLACPMCNQEMEGSPLEVGLNDHDEVVITFEPDWDDDV